MRDFGQEINSGPFADIAFILLIFFLVATTLTEEKGVRQKLAKACDDVNCTQEIDKDLVLTVAVLPNNELRIEDQPATIEEIKTAAQIHIAKDPNRHLIHLVSQEKTRYADYLNVLSHIQEAKKDMRMNLAEQLFQKDYEELLEDEAKKIRDAIPFKFVEGSYQPNES